MIAPERWLELILGLVVIGAVLNDVFQSVVVPRPVQGRFRIGRLLIVGSWRLWRYLADRRRTDREHFLGVFAPLAVTTLLIVWITFLVVGFALGLYALREQIRPVPQDFGEALYFAAESLLTIGFGEYLATEGATRFLATAAGAAGLGTVALVVTFLFSLYGSFQRRETLVATLDAPAGAPPSGVTFLVTHASLAMVDELPATFGRWEAWSAEVLETHIAYPILAYFRSTHDNESWIGAIGAMLDAATLVLTTIEGVPRGRAAMLHDLGNHLVEDLTQYFGLERGMGAGVERSEFDDARARLEDAGYAVCPADPAWHDFETQRAQYAGSLNALARFWAVPPSQWIGDRSLVRHAR
ncbi:MAG: ion channel [Candidatus Limnocylindria bacterium]